MPSRGQILGRLMSPPCVAISKPFLSWHPLWVSLTRRQTRPAFTKSCLKSAVAVTAAKRCSSADGSGGSGGVGDESRHLAAARLPPDALKCLLSGDLRANEALKSSARRLPELELLAQPRRPHHAAVVNSTRIANLMYNEKRRGLLPQHGGGFPSKTA